jgi:uncharacterized membrane protein YdbT with pleckstrin-like domain
MCEILFKLPANNIATVQVLEAVSAKISLNRNVFPNMKIAILTILLLLVLLLLLMVGVVVTVTRYFFTISESSRILSHGHLRTGKQSSP